MSEPNNVVESSSDDEETTSISNTGSTERSSTPNSPCPICFDKITNPCHTDSCLHSFCFECLQRWSNSKRFCPLCKATYSNIYHSFDDQGIHETCDLPILLEDSDASSDYDSDSGSDDFGRSLPGRDRVLYSDAIGQIQHNPISETTIIGQAMRIQVYVRNMWAEPLQDETDPVRDPGPEFYRDNPLHMNRLHLFILRDVIAVRECHRLESQAMPYLRETNITVTNFIIRSLLTHERELHMVDRMRNFLDNHVEHFCHELYIFYESAYDIDDYDLNVRHIYRPRSTELTEEIFEPNLDNEEVQMPIIITDESSSTDDSDVVTQSRSIHSIQPLNSVSIDKPFTSTGIQDSLNRPNNSFQSVDIGSSQNLSHVRRETPILDFLSDDDDSMIATRDSKTAHIKSRDNHNKINKTTKININDSVSEIPSTNRNRSNSESSSTSEETEIN